MAIHKVKKGLDLPILGEPEQKISEGPALTKVGVVADEIVGLKPRMHVKEGDKVLKGQPLFEHRKVEGLIFSAPAAGKVVAINRGARRALLSVVIELDADPDAQIEVSASDADEAAVRKALLTSGLWTALRQRPFSSNPGPSDPVPLAIFVTAMDTQPHAPDLDLIYAGREVEFQKGVDALSKIAKVIVCKRAGSAIRVQGARVEEFSGVHPAGNVGTHIHMLSPVNGERVVWHLGIQDVLAIGHLFATGKIDTERVVSLAGPAVKSPRLVRTRLGASIDALCEGELKDGEVRTISGSVLSGRQASGDVLGYLGRYHQQVSALREDREREFLGWLTPGSKRFSTIRAFLSALRPHAKFPMTTTTNGSFRAMVPIGMYERVTPIDVMPTFLLRALAMKDVERAEELGALELDEEDVALWTFVCPGKQDYGPMLRDVLGTIQRGE